MGAALGFNRMSLAEIQGNGIAWTPGPVTPSPAAPEIAAAAAQTTGGVSTRFAAGQTVRNLTNSRVNIRSTPGYLSKPTADIVATLPPGQTITLTGDSQRVDNLVWWGVQTTVGGQTVEGWIAEATASGVQILGPTQ